MKDFPVSLLILKGYDIMSDIPKFYFWNIHHLKVPKWCAAGADSKQPEHVTDAQMTSKVLLQVPVEIFKEPDAASLCLMQLSVSCDHLPKGCVIQYAEISNIPSCQFLSVFIILSSYLLCACIQEVNVHTMCLLTYICMNVFIYIYKHNQTCPLTPRCPEYLHTCEAI